MKRLTLKGRIGNKQGKRIEVSSSVARKPQRRQERERTKGLSVGCIGMVALLYMVLTCDLECKIVTVNIGGRRGRRGVLGDSPVRGHS
jgi:hypothetical protein